MKRQTRNQLNLLFEEPEESDEPVLRTGLVGPDGNPRYTVSLADAEALLQKLGNKNEILWLIAAREVNGWASGFYEQSANN